MESAMSASAQKIQALAANPWQGAAQRLLVCDTSVGIGARTGGAP